MAKYLQRSCPKCNGYLGLVVPKRKAKTAVQAINGRCAMGAAVEDSVCLYTMLDSPRIIAVWHHPRGYGGFFGSFHNCHANNRKVLDTTQLLQGSQQIVMARFLL